MDSVRLAVLVGGSDSGTLGQGDLQLGETDLGDDDGAGNGHHAAGQQGGGIGTEGQETQENGTRDGGETRGQDLVQLGVSHLRDEGTDQHGSLGHADEGGSASGDTLDTRDVNDVDNQGSHAGDDGLDNVVVVQALDDRSEQDDGGQDRDGKGAIQGDNVAVDVDIVGAKDELATLGGIGQEVLGLLGNELEHIITDGPADDEQAKEVLHEDAGPDDLPGDSLAVLCN